MAIKLKITNGTYSAEIEAGKTATVKCGGKKLGQDIVFEAVEVSDKCVFYLNYLDAAVLEFEFTEGQTWYKYCGGADSGTAGAMFYCTQDVFYAGNADKQYVGSGLRIRYDSNGNDVTPSTVIKKGETYTIPPGDTGGAN